MSALPLAESLALVAGIALLIAGGEALVHGAAALGRQLGVPSLAVGLTVVAFGTSAPELAVNVTAVVEHHGAVAFGNVVGSNLANVGLVLACAALVRRLSIQSVVLRREMPLLLLASAAALMAGFDGPSTQSASRYDRTDGVVFLLLFAIFLCYIVVETLRARSADPLVEQVREPGTRIRTRSPGASSVLVVVGLAALALGGHWAVQGAAGVASALGAPEELIGLTVVALGTSLPELSASLVAARRGETDLALGNVVGSNIFNLLFVLGVTTTIGPVPVPPGGHADLVAMTAFAAILLPLSARRRGMARAEGALLLSAYLGYLAWRAL